MQTSSVKSNDNTNPHIQNIPSSSTAGLAPSTDYLACGCGKKFKTPRRLHRHELRFHKIPEEQQKSAQFRERCPWKDCDYLLGWSAKPRIDHMLKEHSTPLPTPHFDNSGNTDTLHQASIGSFSLESACGVSGCNYLFLNLLELHSHEVNYHRLSEEQQKSKELGVQCFHVGCESFFGSPNRLKQHMERAHSSKIRKPMVQQITCVVARCRYVSTDPRSLHHHEVVHHKLQEGLQKSVWFKIPCRLDGCGDVFWTKHEFREHVAVRHIKLSAKLPSIEFRCVDCDCDFPSAKQLDAHLKNTVDAVRETLLEPAPNTCETCNKTFKTANGLNSHSKSAKHKGISASLPCIHPGCRKQFSSPAAMLNHLESGKCSSNINTQTVNKAIMNNDPTGIITEPNARQGLDNWHQNQQSLLLTLTKEDPKHLIGNAGEQSRLLRPLEADEDDEDSDEDDGGVAILTPNSFYSADIDGAALTPCLNGELTPLSSAETPRFSGGMLTPRSHQGAPNPLILQSLLSLSASASKTTHSCPLCPTQRVFHSSFALQAHIESAAHAPKIYHCPISLLDPDLMNISGKKRSHLRKFNTLSGLARHLEAEACKGGKDTLMKVIKFVEGKFKEMGFEGRFLAGAEVPQEV